ncbi:hypothetical protein [Formosa algae]|uniref:Copper export protein n=1 Tax=Formosa algae TaxID=225843 RepID=A0A9X1C7W0_9FLAO|nr:hypothetical protein [Formosa algae]MBP1838111.1 putative copper export protein [Formosa algae]MDQ0334246.1 putative copper export protein [Formosa algae]OEI80106.1 hypothetical protein AST99_11160 [Formosa algae]
MKKTAFYISLIIALLLFINVVQIIATDLERLTEYGYGYLIGKVILFIIFAAIALLTRSKSVNE